MVDTPRPSDPEAGFARPNEGPVSLPGRRGDVSDRRGAGAPDPNAGQDRTLGSAHANGEARLPGSH